MTESQKPARNAGRTLARNTLVGLGATFALKLARIVFNIYVVRALGEGQFGQYYTVVAWASLFSVLGDLGVTQYLTREIARDPARKDELFWDTVILRFFFAILATVVTVTGAMTLGKYSTEIVIGTALFCATYFFQIIMAPLKSILEGNERLDLSNMLEVVMQVLTMIFSALFLFMGLPFVWLFVAGLISLPVIIVLQTWLVRRLQLHLPKFQVNRKLWRKLVIAGLPFGLIQLSLSFNWRVDTVILSQTVSDGEVGWYNVAYSSLVMMLLSITSSFSSVTLPTLSREHASRPDSVKAWYFNAARVLMALGLPIAVGTTLIADKLIAFLYQPSIGPAWIALAILIWDVPFVMYHSFCGNVTQSIRKERAAARIYFSLGLANVLLNLLLIPRFGIIGASFATVLTDMFGALQYYFLLRHELGRGLQFNRVIRVVLGSGLMGIILFVLRDSLHVIPLVVIGGVFYAVFVWVSGVFSVEERERLVGFVARRLRLRAA